MNFLKNICSAIALFLLTATSSARADCDDFDSCYPCTEISFYDSCDSCNFRFNGKGFFRADVLYLRAQEGGFGCGCTPELINNFVTSDGEYITVINEKFKDPNFDWNTGFRLGTGYTFTEKCWDVGVYWTHYHSRNNRHCCGDSSSGSGYTNDVTFTPISGSRSYSDEGSIRGNNFCWKLDYNVVDLLFGRDFRVNCFSFKPFIGVRWAKINQKVKSTSRLESRTVFGSESSGDLLGGSAQVQVLLGSEDNKQKFKGVGPVFGLEVNWSVGYDLSLFAGVSGSTLYGHFNQHFTGFNTFLNGTNHCDKREHANSCQFATDAIIGVRWKKCYCDNVEVTLQLALEQHRYFDHNRLGEYGDLCLDGGSFAASVSF